MNNKVKRIMSVIFEIPAELINDNSSPETIEKWDSLQHINLITSLEEEFNIQFSDEEIVEMLNYQLITYIVNQKISK